MTRTDIHRPSAIEPKDYDFVACDYYGPYGGLIYLQDRITFQNHLKATGGKHSDHEHGGTCHVCGAGALYVARFWHRATNTYIVTGFDCAEKMHMGSASAFRSFRNTVANGKAFHAGKIKAASVLDEQGLSAAFEIYSAKDKSKYEYEENTIESIVYKLVKYGTISPKQIDFVRALLARIDSRAAIKAQREAQKASSQHVGVEGERREFVLTVKAVPSFDTDYGTLYVHICRDDAGNTVIYKGKEIATKGQRIKLVATVKRHGERDGEKQTVIARPAKVEVMEEGA